MTLPVRRKSAPLIIAGADNQCIDLMEGSRNFLATEFSPL